jgi:hypothetical protein
MTLDRAEFLRLLRGAVGPDWVDEAGGFAHRDGSRQWRIRLAPLPPLRLGTLVLPRLRVELDLDGYPPEAAEAFVARFLQHYQRGGG